MVLTREKAGIVLELMLATDHTLFSETEKDAIKTAVELMKEENDERKTSAESGE